MDYHKQFFLKSLFVPPEVNYSFSVSVFFNIYKCTTNNIVEKSEDLIKILKRSEKNCFGELSIFSEPFKCLITIRNNIVHNSNRDYSKEGEDFINAISSLEHLVKKRYDPSFHQLFRLYKQYVQVSLNNANSGLWKIKESDEILNVVDRSIKDIEISKNIQTLVLSSDFDDFESLKSIPKTVSTLNIDLGEKKDGEIELFIPKTVKKTFITRIFSRKEVINKHIEGEWEIDYDKPLGFGSFSIGTYKAKKLDGIINSKQISNDGYCLIEIFEFEKNMVDDMVVVLKRLMDIKNKNIIQFYGYAIGQSKNNKNCLFVYMEYLKEYKTIREMLINKIVFSEIEIKKIAHYLVGSLISLNENKIIHGDIKSEHILYNESSGQVKLSGFPLSQKGFYGIFGTLIYMAPEAIQDRVCSKSDIWSLGCTIIEMAGGNLTEKIGSAPVIPDSLSRECKNFIQHCLIIDVEARPHPNKLINHQLFNQPITPNSIPSPVTELYLDKLMPGSIPSSVTSLHLSPFNQPITPNSIPSSVTKLYLPSFNQPITPNSIPSSVTELDLSSFDQPITPNSIPSSVTSLYLSPFNQPITPNSIPSSITELDLPSFNQPITPNSIPSSVTKLYLPSFDQPITPDSMPSSVTELDLSFNQPITPNSIPSSVTDLYLHSFNQPITPNSIPSSVTKLYLPSFDQPITPNSIPSSVTELHLSSFDQPITPNSIPSSVTELDLPSFNQPITPNSIPSSVTKLYLPSFNQPITLNSKSSVTKLYLPSFNQPITPNSIPSSVTELDLPSFNQPITPNSIPSSVTSLYLHSFNQPITPNSIPSSVTELALPSFNQYLEEGSITSQTTKLILGKSFDLNEDGSFLPSSIHYFACDFNFSSPLKKNNNIPRRVFNLFLNNYNQKIVKDSIPSSVHTLVVGSNFKDFESFINIPSSVINLRFGVKDGNKSDEEYYKYIPSHVTSIKINRYHSNHKEEEWKIGPKIYGNVFKATKLDHIINGQIIQDPEECAIKIIDYKKMVNIENLCILLNKLKDIRNDNIIKIYGCANKIDKDDLFNHKLFIYMQYLKDYKSIKDELSNNAFTKNQIVEITKILANSFLFLEEIAIPFGGFSIENIYIDNNKNIKIGLNLSMFYKNGDIKLSGKPIEFQKNYSESYAFNLGCLIIEMAGGDLKEMEGSVPIIPDSLSDKCKDFIQNCLRADLKSSLKVKELINHEFLIDSNDKQEDTKLQEETDNDLAKKFSKIDINTETDDIDYKIKANCIEFPDFDKSISIIKKYILSPIITHLKLPIFNQQIEPNSIPPSITTLSLPEFNQSIEPESIPSTIRFLSLSTLSNDISPNSIPSQLVSLTLSSFNELLPVNFFYLSIKSLKLPLFNQPISPNSLTNSLISLTLSTFNHPIEPGALPPTLKFLSLPLFNHPIKPNLIPPSLKSLTLESFNQPLIQNSIPSSIILLNLPSFYYTSTLIYIPSSVKQLTLPHEAAQINLDYINVRHIKYADRQEFNQHRPEITDEEQFGFALDFKDLLKKGQTVKVFSRKLRGVEVVFIKWNGTNAVVSIENENRNIYISIYDTISIKWKDIADNNSNKK